MARMSNIQFAESLQGISIDVDASDLNLTGSDTPDGFRWVQTVITNDPLNGTDKETVDQGKQSTPFTDPFYYRTPTSQKDPGHFDDHPHRGIPDPGQTIIWDATLTLAALDLKGKRLVAHDLRTYGFELTLMRGTTMVTDVKLAYPTQNWAALAKHIKLVQSTYPSWEYSLLKFRA